MSRADVRMMLSGVMAMAGGALPPGDRQEWYGFGCVGSKVSISEFLEREENAL